MSEAEEIDRPDGSSVDALYEPVSEIMRDISALCRGFLPPEEGEDTELAVSLYLETHPKNVEVLHALLAKRIERSGMVGTGGANSAIVRANDDEGH